MIYYANGDVEFTMQCWLTCIVGYIAPTPLPLPHGMGDTNKSRGFHGYIKKFEKVQKISIISSHYEGARLVYIKTKKGIYGYIYVYVAVYA